MMSRKVIRAFEAWDPAFRMVVIMNSGADLRVVGITFNQRLAPGLPPLERAVEFESGGTRYYAAFERLQENTSGEETDRRTGGG